MSKYLSVAKNLFFLMAVVFGLIAPRLAMAADSKIEQDSRAALNSLYAGSPGAKALGAKARGVLAFPKVIKAGLVVGGQGGDGVLLVNDKVSTTTTLRQFRSAFRPARSTSAMCCSS